MKVTYIHHSSFLVETEPASLLFDYTEGPVPEPAEGKPLLILASHRHGDHFSERIFALARQYPDSRLVLSDDIWRKRVPEELRDRTDFLGPGESLLPWPAKKLEVEAFRSTDEGAAFLVTAGGEVAYHAGDLNNWRWDGEDESWNEQMNQLYHQELSKLAGRRIDVAFLPLDPRQERWFYLGLDEFMKEVGAGRVFPMHFWGDYGVTERLKRLKCSEGYRDRVVEIRREGEVFTV